MILFKRVGSAFKGIEGREWALLALETLGVVAGILIAFWLNEWAQSRAEDRHRAALMARLFDESEATVSVLREDRDVLDKIVKRERAFATQLDHKGQCPPEPMWKAVDTLTVYPTISIPSTVYQELMSAGGLAEIDNAKLRTAIGNFRSMVTWAQGQNEYFRAHAWQVEASDHRVRYDFDESADEPQVSYYQRDALCADLAFRNGIAEAVRGHWVIQSLRGDIATRAIRICAMIGSTLGKTCTPPLGGPLEGEDLKTATDAIADLRSPNPLRAP